MKKSAETNLDIVVTVSNELDQATRQLTGNANHRLAGVLLHRLILVSQQAAALHESLKDLIEMCIADCEADETY